MRPALKKMFPQKVYASPEAVVKCLRVLMAQPKPAPKPVKARKHGR
jgi:hypothetical protein